VPIKLKTTATQPHAAPKPSTTVAKAAAAKKTKALESVDAPGAKAAAKINGPTAVSAAATLTGIAEAFPIDALSKIDGKGLGGTTFLLDGGSLRGLKLQMRRVVDGDQSGFELSFQLTEGKLGGLLDRLKQKDAKSGAITFRGAELDDKGVAKLTSQVTTITSSSTHAPKNLSSNASAWALSLTDAKGGKISVVHDRAALAVRGLVRIDLRGSDADCTEQLKALVNSLGLQHVIAPPTAKSKQINMLMRALWQADNAAATSFAAEDLDKLKPKDLEAALESVGYTPERIAGMSYQEVFPGHFTAVDPMQATAMVDAGARYLYSTVTMPEHVHSILENGQKSSVQRYREGLIIDGMSTGADFVTGGGAGVFTRLVTQNAIYGEESWQGRTYKMLQNVAQLGRTDFYGWDGDYFGRRWDLETKENFGPDLVKKIDADGSYASSNELIFTAGNRPQNIDRVIATSDEDKKLLIDHLSSKGYKPHNGLSLEEFVVTSPNFMMFGPSPYAGVTDIPAFTTEALAASKAGSPSKLQWLLFEGPGGPDRAALEEKLLLSGPEAARDVLLKAAARNGKLELSAEKLDAVLTKMAGGNEKQKAVIARLPEEAAEALFRSGSKKAIEILADNKPDESSWQPYGLSDEAFVRIYEALAPLQEPGKPRSKAFALALEVRAESLLTSGHSGFKSFLAKHPLVTPKNPDTWVTAKLAALKKNGAGKTDLTMYLAQLTDMKTVGDVQKKLLVADSASTLELLNSTVAIHGRIHLPGSELAKLMKALPAKSETRQHLLDAMPAELLKTAEPEMLAMLQAKHKGTYDYQMNIYGGEEWWKIVDAQMGATKGKINDVVKTTMEIGSSYLIDQPEFRALLPKLDGLYDVGKKAKSFAEAATKQMEKGGGAKLGWMILGPERETLRMPALMAILKSEDYQARQILSSVADPPGTFPASADEIRALIATLSTAKESGSLDQLFSAAGRTILSTADAKTLALIEKHVAGKEDVMSTFGLYGESVISLIQELEGKNDEVREFVLREGAGSLIKSDDESFLSYLTTKHLDYTTLGKDAAWAAQTIKESCDNQQYYWTSSYYKDQPEYQKLPAGAAFLMKKGDTYDPDVLGEIAKNVNTWGWQKATFDKFLKINDDLPAEWKTKLKAGFKAS